MKDFIDKLSTLCHDYGVIIYPKHSYPNELFVVVQDQFGNCDFELIDANSRLLLD